MVRGDSTGAAEGFKKLARQYPASPLASRALYAAGWIYENRLSNRDSALASYAKLVALYPGSLYAARIASKMAEVNQKLKQDALPDTSVSRRTVGTPPSAVPDSLQRRNMGFPPKPGRPVDDTIAVRRNPPTGPGRVPDKEGPTPR